MFPNRTTSRVAQILELISRSAEPPNLTSISRELDIPKSTASDIVYTLMEARFLEYDHPRLKTFRLGLGFIEPALRWLGKTDLVREARLVLDELLTITGTTVYLAMEDSDEVLYLDKAEGDVGFRYITDIGTRLPMHCTALGKALLAAGPGDELAAKLERMDLKALTAYSLTDLQSLTADLEQTRQRRYAIDDQESVEGVACVAAPIYDAGQSPVAAMSISGPLRTMTPERIGEFGKLLSSRVLELSRRLGFTGAHLFPEAGPESDKTI